ncbi:cytosine permease [Corynebacterium casei]|uniref:Purine cytosine permease n=2 Tax=Corynebacterium casei TaxID=160386 RepID=G7HUE3_9CORY|nr:cytosine permease [Corynebacterium casei]AHI18683.1 cytosine permease [Corynebacterium casei LMG S-19264]CCE53808.1 purine cytosine permease [Corynebacterium casei UCMA 3821]
MSISTTSQSGHKSLETDLEPVDPDYPVTPVPLHARKKFVSLAIVLLGFTVFTPTMLSGAELGLAFKFSQLLMVVALGSLILGSYVSTLGWIGARTGLTTVVMARYVLGTRGAKFASLLLGGTQVGWYGVIIGTVGSMTATAFSWDSYSAQIAIMVVASVLMCLTACYGYKGMYWVSAISTPLILVLAVWVVFKCLEQVHGWAGLLDLEPASQMSLGVAITTVVGTFVSAGTQAPNWTRFAKSGNQAIWACVIGFIVGNGLMIFFGAIGAMTFGEGDFVVILYQLGLVALGLVLLFGNLWKSNADTAYAFGVAGAEIFEKNNKLPFVVGGSIIGTLLAVFGVHNHLTDFLYLLGVFIPPLGGVIIGDYIMRWSRTQMPEGTEIPRYNAINIGIYVVASVLAYSSTMLGIGIPPLVGIFSAIILVVLVNKLRRTSKA